LTILEKTTRGKRERSNRLKRTANYERVLTSRNLRSFTGNNKSKKGATVSQKASKGRGRTNIMLANNFTRGGRYRREKQDRTIEGKIGRDKAIKEGQGGYDAEGDRPGRKFAANPPIKKRPSGGGGKD